MVQEVSARTSRLWPGGHCAKASPTHWGLAWEGFGKVARWEIENMRKQTQSGLRANPWSA